MHDYDEEERWLIEHIEAIQREYQKAIKPYVDRLVQIRSWKLPDPIVIKTNEFLLSLPKKQE
jgi:hypothetical protein